MTFRLCFLIVELIQTEFETLIDHLNKFRQFVPDDGLDAVEDSLRELLLHQDEGSHLLHDVLGVGGEDHHVLQQGHQLGPGQGALVVCQLELEGDVVTGLVRVQQPDGRDDQVGGGVLAITVSRMIFTQMWTRNLLVFFLTF